MSYRELLTIFLLALAIGAVFFAEVLRRRKERANHEVILMMEAADARQWEEWKKEIYNMIAEIPENGGLTQTEVIIHARKRGIYLEIGEAVRILEDLITDMMITRHIVEHHTIGAIEPKRISVYAAHNPKYRA